MAGAAMTDSLLQMLIMGMVIGFYLGTVMVRR
jgi:hypothetical protein